MMIKACEARTGKVEPISTIPSNKPPIESSSVGTGPVTRNGGANSFSGAYRRTTALMGTIDYWVKSPTRTHLISVRHTPDSPKRGTGSWAPSVARLIGPGTPSRGQGILALILEPARSGAASGEGRGQTR